jgi:hypothetical protein
MALPGVVFKTRPGGVNHIASGIDNVRSFCGSAFFSSTNPKTKMVGKRAGIDELLKSHSKICQRCEPLVRAYLEKERAYLDR